ncbi:YgaP family membrane protein [Noviherbaspirillum massiliense]|uniref:YgaP family membrane protein n=1 Tax=Noviherbaspirillum massiliense TaxID=1465823 RepID=UPI0003176763|nr:DUF2892 domain-containing protein [Noviherbaspirillum massiliense]
MAIPHNVGGTDKAARLMAGLALPAYALLSRKRPLLRGIAGAAGLVALATGLSGYCPLNGVLGIDTSRRKAVPGSLV